MNWAIFERPDSEPIHDVAVTAIGLDDEDLLATLALFDLKLARGR